MTRGPIPSLYTSYDCVWKTGIIRVVYEERELFEFRVPLLVIHLVRTDTHHTHYDISSVHVSRCHIHPSVSYLVNWDGTPPPLSPV